MNITVIVGSIRPERESIKPALYIKSKLVTAGYEVNFVDLLELDLPLFKDTTEQMNLPSVRQFIESILSADAIIAVFPEYNHDVGGALRNAFSFLRKREFMHRPLGLVGVSIGQLGGVRAVYAAKASFPTLGAVILPSVVQVANVSATFPNEKTCTDEKIDASIENLIKEVAAYSSALSSVRKQLAD